MKNIILIIILSFARVLVASSRDGTRIDQFALHRAEFEEYYRLITAKDAPNNIIEFSIDAGVSKSGKDAYRIQSMSPSSVRITGSDLRSVI